MTTKESFYAHAAELLDILYVAERELLTEKKLHHATSLLLHARIEALEKELSQLKAFVRSIT